MSDPQLSPMVYVSVVEFVENYLSLVYRRQVNDRSDTVWCPHWWKHAEAVARLDALWRAWEYYRLNGKTGMSVWFIDHADVHMHTLLDQRGPFKYCSARNGHQDMLNPLPLKSPPPDLFRDASGTDSETASGSAEFGIFHNVVEFVENYLSLVYRRQVSDLSDTVWCPEWWRHSEAIARLDALWRAWEYYRLDGRTGLSVWFLDHADPHMFKLLDQRGPFKYCSARGGHQDMLAPLPLKSPPPNMFAEPAVSVSDSDSGGAQSTVYGDVVEFVENYLSLLYRRQVVDLSDTVWCPLWWMHAEAVVRLDALWRAWEHYRLDATTGLSVWFLDHADVHMARLIDQRGPFKYCGVEKGHQDMLDPLPLSFPGDILFRDPALAESDSIDSAGDSAQA